MKKKSLLLGLAIAAASLNSFADGLCDQSVGAAGSKCADAVGNPAFSASTVGSCPVGIAVSTTIRDVMQAATFGEGSSCIGNDSVLCMPGISSSEFAAIYNGGVSSWSQIVAGGTTSSNLFEVCTGGDTNRAAGRTANWGNPNFAPDDGSTLAALQTCMDATDTFGRGAGSPIEEFGILPANAVTADYRFIKLDGAAPIVGEHLSGNYNLVMNTDAVSYTTTAMSFGDVACGLASAGAPVKASVTNVDNTQPPQVRTGALMPDTP